MVTVTGQWSWRFLNPAGFSTREQNCLYDFSFCVQVTVNGNIISLCGRVPNGAVWRFVPILGRFFDGKKTGWAGSTRILGKKFGLSWLNLTVETICPFYIWLSRLNPNFVKNKKVRVRLLNLISIKKTRYSPDDPYYSLRLRPVHTCLYVRACRLVTGTSSTLCQSPPSHGPFQGKNRM